jgi:hypothetical protein
MCLGGPKMPPTPPPAPAPPTQASPDVINASAAAAQRAAAAGSVQTMLTGSQGLTSQTTTMPKSLLGE